MASGELKTHPVFVFLCCLASLFAAFVVFMYVSNARVIATPVPVPATASALPPTWVLGVTHNDVEVDVISTNTLCIYTARGLQRYNGVGLVVLRKAEMEGGMCQ